MSAPLTILGASGFIGTHLLRLLRVRGENCFAPERSESLAGRDLGDVIYCVGLTADFRTHPHETIEAHVCLLNRILRESNFKSLTYLSSTRLYHDANEPAHEETAIKVNPLLPDDLYNISKVAGESIALRSERTTRVVRLSNVYGDDTQSENFLSEIIKHAISRGKVNLRTTLESAKDYVSVCDVAELLVVIARRGRQRIYNVASGRNTSNGELLARLASLTGCEYEIETGAATVAFPRISIERVREEFDFTPANVLDDLQGLVKSYEEAKDVR